MTVEQRHDNDLWPIAETQKQQRRDAYQARWRELEEYFQKPITADQIGRVSEAAALRPAAPTCFRRQRA